MNIAPSSNEHTAVTLLSVSGSVGAVHDREGFDRVRVAQNANATAHSVSVGRMSE